MLEIVERVVGHPTGLLDLASGPGSIASRAAERFPDTHLFALDVDPFLLELGRRTRGAAAIEFLEADLRQAGWDEVLPAAGLNAVCTATSLHYLTADQIVSLAVVLANRLPPDGVFVNIDTMRLGEESGPRLDHLAVALREHLWDGDNPVEVEGWQGWWTAARAEPAFATLLAERDRRLISPDPDQAPITLADMTNAFRSAGFAEVGVLAQEADKHTFVAIR
ncbi:class I SAM-dependent methyltransferase [Kribbella catacumbae]|uniref:class I SAM-dependent methyltransferase n=1 Tax=Kribbella catacumbae TaxID=460086 RepID=UPI001ED99A15|nr:class I SAM-dependent methyltransferase [Kribbella catacumbae]